MSTVAPFQTRMELLHASCTMLYTANYTVANLKTVVHSDSCNECRFLFQKLQLT
jgi:hypothetical protein